MQVASSERHLHEGHLGEVTIRGGAVTSPTPPNPPPKNPLQKERDRETNQQQMYPIFSKMKKPKPEMKTKKDRKNEN